jgi:hypothetical protein
MRDRGTKGSVGGATRVGVKSHRTRNKKSASEYRAIDEFYLNSMDEVLKRWPDELWVAKGKPKLWVKVYEKENVIVWRDVGYGGIKLKTPDGVDEGKDKVSVKGVVAILSGGTLQVDAKNRDVLRVTEIGETEDGISLQEDTLDLNVEPEPIQKTPTDDTVRKVLPRQRFTRKVSLSKIYGMGMDRSGPLIGWECAPPKRNERYGIFLRKRKTLRTSPVEEITETHDALVIKTVNSLYEIKYLE